MHPMYYRRAPLRLTQVSCSRLHNAVLTTEGEVFAWSNMESIPLSPSPSASPLLSPTLGPSGPTSNTHSHRRLQAKIVKSLRRKKVLLCSPSVILTCLVYLLTSLSSISLLTLVDCVHLCWCRSLCCNHRRRGRLHLGVH